MDIAQAPELRVQLWFACGSIHDPPTLRGLSRLAQQIVAQRIREALPAAAENPTIALLFERDACCIEFSPSTGVGAHSGKTERALLEVVLRAASRGFSEEPIGAAELQRALGAIRTPPSAEPEWLESDALGALFPNHPYRYLPLECSEELFTIDPASVSKHLERWFAPPGATVLVFGSVSPEIAAPMMRRALADVSWREAGRRADFDPPPDDRVAQPVGLPVAPGTRRIELCAAWVTPPFGAFEIPAIEVLMQSMTNAVDGALRLDASAPSLESHSSAWRHAGVTALTAQVKVDPANERSAETAIAAFVATIDAALSAAGARPLTEVQLNRARALAALNAGMQRLDYADYCRCLARHEVIAGDILLSEYELPRLRRVSAPDVMLAARLLETSRRVIVLRGLAESRAATAPAPTLPLRRVAGDRALARLLPRGGPAASSALSQPTLSPGSADNVCVKTEPRSWADHVLVRLTPARVNASEADFEAALLRARTAIADARAVDYLSYREMRLEFSESDRAYIGVAPRSSVDSLIELFTRCCGTAEK